MKMNQNDSYYEMTKFWVWIKKQYFLTKVVLIFFQPILHEKLDLLMFANVANI